MVKSDQQETDLVAAKITACVDKILALRGNWLEAGKVVSEGADLQQDVEAFFNEWDKYQDMEGFASEAVKEWRKLSEALIGWALPTEIRETARAEDAREALMLALIAALAGRTNDDFVVGIFPRG
jgi:hypothetical protein